MENPNSETDNAFSPYASKFVIALASAVLTTFGANTYFEQKAQVDDSQHVDRYKAVEQRLDAIQSKVSQIEYILTQHVNAMERSDYAVKLRNIELAVESLRQLLVSKYR